jgi:hypothetical protein
MLMDGIGHWSQVPTSEQLVTLSVDHPKKTKPLGEIVIPCR